MKSIKLTSTLAALTIAALGSCTYHETQTSAAPGYGSSEVITTLPDGYRTVTVQGDRYYTWGDRYYRQHDGGYVVVESPYRESRTTVIRELPGNYRTIQHHGQSYYRVGDVYYQRSGGGYVVVDRPF